MAVTDNAPEFDTLAYVRTLKAAGVDSRQAEAHAEATRESQARLATKADLVALRMEMRADLYRALWIQGAGIVATIAGLAVIAGLVAAFFG